MPRVPITVVAADNTSLLPTAGNAVDHHQFQHSSKRVLLVRNADASSKSVTVSTPGQVAGNDIAERVVPVAAGATVKIDTRDPVYRQNTGLVHVDLSAATQVTLGVLELS